MVSPCNIPADASCMLNWLLLVRKTEANLLYSEQFITRPFSRRKVVEKS